MTVNIYDSANQIEREIRQLPEFEELKAAYEAIKADEEDFALFSEFQNLQRQLQEKQFQGEDFTEEEIQQAQELAEKVQESERINTLMAKEQAFSMIINDLNRIIMQPIQELYAE